MTQFNVADVPVVLLNGNSVTFVVILMFSLPFTECGEPPS